MTTFDDGSATRKVHVDEASHGRPSLNANLSSSKFLDDINAARGRRSTVITVPVGEDLPTSEEYSRALALSEEQGDDAGDESNVSCQDVARIIALSHYMLYGPLRYNFLVSYLNPHFEWKPEFNWKYGLGLTCRLLLMIPVVVLVPQVYSLARPVKFCESTEVVLGRNTTSVMDGPYHNYSMQLTNNGPCEVERFLNTWHALLIGPVLVAASVGIDQCMQALKLECGRRLMMRVYLLCHQVVPKAANLKYHRSPAVYTWVTQGYLIFNFEALLLGIYLQNPGTLLFGYLAGKVLVHIAGSFLAPPDHVLAKIHAELRTSACSCVLLSLLDHSLCVVSITPSEVEAIREACAPPDNFEHELLKDVRNSHLTFVGSKRRVFWTSLFIKEVDFVSRGDVRPSQLGRGTIQSLRSDAGLP